MQKQKGMKIMESGVRPRTLRGKSLVPEKLRLKTSSTEPTGMRASLMPSGKATGMRAALMPFDGATEIHAALKPKRKPTGIHKFVV